MKKNFTFIVLLATFSLHTSLAQTDYFLTEFAAGNCKYVEPNGGILDLDNNGINLITFHYWNIPKVVQPDQVVNTSLSYSWNDGCPSCVVFKNVFAEWQPDSPLATFENGNLQGGANSAIKEFSFTAPSIPGIYRIRHAMTWAFSGIQNFYGGPTVDPFYPGTGPFSEILLKVENPPQTDYFLTEFAAGNCKYVEPNGGILDLDNNGINLITFHYWNIPKVVQPDQVVNTSLSYSWNDGCPSCVVFKNVFAEWQPDSPLATFENGNLQGGANSAIKEFSFTAPSIPGIYRIRHAMTWAFSGIQNFYGGPTVDPFYPGTGPFSEVLLKVENPPQTDYYLTAPEGGNCKYVEPNGGILDQDNNGINLITFHYWNIPKVVHPDQAVSTSLSYSWNNGCPGCIVYKNVFAEWQPDSPIATFENGNSQGQANTVVREFSFTTPSTPGTYRVRLTMAWAFGPILSFYGGPVGGPSDPGVGPYSEIEIVVQDITDVPEINRGNMMVYPNPANHHFSIEGLQTGVIEIFNATGQIIKTNQINKHKSDIDISKLPGGIYFLKVSDEEENLFSTEKLIKK